MSDLPFKQKLRNYSLLIYYRIKELLSPCCCCYPIESELENNYELDEIIIVNNDDSIENLKPNTRYSRFKYFKSSSSEEIIYDRDENEKIKNDNIENYNSIINYNFENDNINDDNIENNNFENDNINDDNIDNDNINDDNIDNDNINDDNIDNDNINDDNIKNDNIENDNIENDNIKNRYKKKEKEIYL